MQKLNPEDSLHKFAIDLAPPTTIAQEIKKHRTVKCFDAYGYSNNPSRHRRNCHAGLLCG